MREERAKVVSDSLEKLLKGNVPVRILSFCVVEFATSFKYHYDEFVDYNGDFLTVDEAIKRFKDEHKFCQLICVDIMTKTILNEEEKQYKWDCVKIG